MAYSLIIQR